MLLQESKLRNKYLQEALGQARAKWIDVKDRLPDIGDEYNVVLDLQDGDKPVSSTLFFEITTKRWMYQIHLDEECTVPVLFWQPLPSPPNT